MQIDESRRQFVNAFISIQASLEPDSKVTLESAEHSAKHRGPSFSSAAGMQIDESDEQS
jgi:hypothetical protein